MDIDNETENKKKMKNQVRKQGSKMKNQNRYGADAQDWLGQVHPDAQQVNTFPQTVKSFNI